jgi:hypothetical protein
MKYELRFISQKTTFFIVTGVKTSNLTGLMEFLCCDLLLLVEA